MLFTFILFYIYYLLIFLSFFFFFFFYRYFSWQTLRINRIVEKEEGIIIFLLFHFNLLTIIHLIHRDFYHFFLIDLFVIIRLLWHCQDWSSYQSITLLLQSECLNQLRLTPLVITVYLSHLLNPIPSHHLSSVCLPKCIRNEKCFIFYKRLGEE